MSVVDLHAHLPMYCAPGPGMSGRLRLRMVRNAGRRSGNFVAGTGAPRVTVPALRRGGVEVALSVLYSPWDEMGLARRDLRRVAGVVSALRALRRHARLPNAGSAVSLALAALVADRPPNRGAFRRLLTQMDCVERFYERRHGAELRFARSPREVAQARADGRVALVHAVEGGFHLPPDPREVPAAVAELARRGVAYVTVAHLFRRGVATVAPAIPYLDDAAFHALFPQPGEGLAAHGRATIEALVAHGVLIDVSHMADVSLHETFELLDRLDPERRVPVLASHVGARLGNQAYNLPDWAIAQIAERGGVVGLIAATHQLADGRPDPATFEESMEVMFGHVDAIAAVTGGHDHTALGTDLGGFIEPLPGVPDAAALAAVRAALERRYGPDAAAAIGAGSALRLLEGHWGSGRS
ncbi:MAG TPA: membrane dipeptidase [Solirubrobacteraceae bacterium]|nr:membrane dipeptidase [Solirubrobacteraceae bacterium]